MTWRAMSARPKLTVVMAPDNLNMSLGESLALAVKEARADKSRIDETRKRDFLTELKRIQRKADAEAGGLLRAST